MKTAAPTITTPPTAAQNGQSFKNANVSSEPEAGLAVAPAGPFVTVILISSDFSGGLPLSSSVTGAEGSASLASASIRPAARPSRRRVGADGPTAAAAATGAPTLDEAPPVAGFAEADP